MLNPKLKFKLEKEAWPKCGWLKVVESLYHPTEPHPVILNNRLTDVNQLKKKERKLTMAIQYSKKVINDLKTENEKFSDKKYFKNVKINFLTLMQGSN